MNNVNQVEYASGSDAKKKINLLLKIIHSIEFISQINEDGLITFDVEFPDFENVPFPLEFSAIAPFYSNIDTTNANENTSIGIGFIEDDEQLDEASQLVQNHFLDGYQFAAQTIIVATWRNVGHYRENNEQQNTFQASGNKLIHTIYAVHFVVSFGFSNLMFFSKRN